MFGQVMLGYVRLGLYSGCELWRLRRWRLCFLALMTATRFRELRVIVQYNSGKADSSDFR